MSRLGVSLTLTIIPRLAINFSKDTVLDAMIESLECESHELRTLELDVGSIER